MVEDYLVIDYQLFLSILYPQLQSADPDSPASDWVHFTFAYVTNPSSGPPFDIQRVSNTSVAIVLEPGYRLERGESHVVSLQITDGMEESFK